MIFCRKQKVGKNFLKIKNQKHKNKTNAKKKKKKVKRWLIMINCEKCEKLNYKD